MHNQGTPKRKRFPHNLTIRQKSPYQDETPRKTKRETIGSSTFEVHHCLLARLAPLPVRVAPPLSNATCNHHSKNDNSHLQQQPLGHRPCTSKEKHDNKWHDLALILSVHHTNTSYSS